MKSGFWAEDLGFCLGFRGLVLEGSGFKFEWSRSFVVLGVESRLRVRGCLWGLRSQV